MICLRIACLDDSFNDGSDQDGELVIYKIGDLGHVTSVKKPQLEDGDCRYMSVEALNLDCTHLFKADMFSLGMTLFEAGGGGPLPKNGTLWHKLRNGEVPDLKGISRDFNKLIKVSAIWSTMRNEMISKFLNTATVTSRSIETAVINVDLSTSHLVPVGNQIEGSTNT